MNNARRDWIQALQLLRKQADMYFAGEITYKELLQIRKKSEKNERELRNIYIENMKSEGLI